MAQMVNAVSMQKGKKSFEIHSGRAGQNTSFQTDIQGVGPGTQTTLLTTPPPTCSCHAVVDHQYLVTTSRI